MAKQTQIDICNQALMILGIEEDVANIEKPSTRWEKRCARYYEPARQKFLTLAMPSFAITPEAINITTKTDGLFYIPADCLRVLRVNGRGTGFHEIGGTIQCDFATSDTISVQYVKDTQDLGVYTAEGCLMLANELAILLAPLTKDNAKIAYANTTLQQNRKEYAGINAQKTKIKKIESRPFIGKGWFYR